ncbi:hypothetical protein GCM10023346_11910 [Arthrobacter gyeryongensis]|uniref:Uncharacterized protein n=2 Tax=Arthrobacter gyeryongensis TaxID=1650592 RepID=A0ABP9S5N6_9MICC
METRVPIARKVLAATSALAIAIIGMTVSSPAASASTTQGQSALDQVLASRPFEGAQSQSSPQAPPGAETQRIEFGDGGSMSIVAADGQRLTVQAVATSQRKSVKQSKGNVKASTLNVDKGHSYVFAQRGDESGAGFVVANNEAAPRSFAFDFTFEGRPADVVVASDGSAVVMDPGGHVVNYIAAPWARDADGRQVPTKYSSLGNRLIQHIEIGKGTAFPVVADPQFSWVGIFPVVEFNKAETAFSKTAEGVLTVCSRLSGGSPVGLAACAISAVQIAVQATIAHSRGECIRLAPAPIGAMAFRYTGGYCR